MPTKCTTGSLILSKVAGREGHPTHAAQDQRADSCDCAQVLDGAREWLFANAPRAGACEFARMVTRPRSRSVRRPRPGRPGGASRPRARQKTILARIARAFSARTRPCWPSNRAPHAVAHQ